MDEEWLLPYVKLIQAPQIEFDDDTDQELKNAVNDIILFTNCCIRCLEFVSQYNLCWLHRLLLLVVHQYVVVVCDPIITKFRIRVAQAQKVEACCIDAMGEDIEATKNELDAVEGDICNTDNQLEATRINTQAIDNSVQEAKHILRQCRTDLISEKKALEEKLRGQVLDQTMMKAQKTFYDKESELFEAQRTIWTTLRRDLPQDELAKDAQSICKKWIAVNVFEVFFAAIASARRWTNDTESFESLDSGVQGWLKDFKALLPQATIFEFESKMVASSAPQWKCSWIRQWECNTRHGRFDVRAKDIFQSAWEAVKPYLSRNSTTPPGIVDGFPGFRGKRIRIRTIDKYGKHKPQCRFCNIIYGNNGLIEKGCKFRKDTQSYKPWQCAEAGLWICLSAPKLGAKMIFERWSWTT